MSATEADLRFADNSADEADFVVQRSPHANFDQIDKAFTLPANPGPTASYADTTVGPITTYYYRAFARNAAGRSGYTNTLSVTTPNAPPAAPVDLSAFVAQTSSVPAAVNLSWNEPVGTASAYVIERRTLPGGAFTTLASVAPTGPALGGHANDEDRTVAVGRQYAYRVYAVNAVGDRSPYSNEVSITVNPLASEVAEINPNAGSFPSSLTTFNGALYFAAADGTRGQELWRSDGTDAGTVLVKDIYPGGAGSAPANLTVVGDTLYFSANDGTHGTELWKSDGTAAGTVLLADLTAGPDPTPLGSFTAVGNSLYFLVSASGPGGTTYTLWRSDGTAAGTAPVPGAPPLGPYSSFPTGPNIAAAGGALYFSTGRGGLWRADASGATWNFPGNVGPVCYDLVPVNGTVYYLVEDLSSNPPDFSLHKVDPSTGTASEVVDLGADGNTAPAYLSATADGTVYFEGSGPVGTVLWKSNGTTAGTAPVTDLGPSVRPGTVIDPHAAGNLLYFDAMGGPVDGALYRTDGTAAGTVRLGPETIDDSTAFTGVGDETFFNARTDLYETDGTAAGTRFVQLTDFQTPLTPAGYFDRAVLNGSLFFPADPTGGNRELYQVAGPPSAGAAPPAVPSGVSVSQPSPGGVVVSWLDNSSDEYGFVIDRSGTPDFATVDASWLAPANATSFVDVNYPPGTTAYYRVSAVSAAGRSAPAGPAGLTTAPAAALLGADDTTQGNWIGAYGALGAGPLQSGPPALPGLVVSPAGQTATTLATGSSDPRALQGPGGGTRGLAQWTSPTSFTVEVDDAADVPRRLELYMVDWDNSGRSQRLDEIDPATGGVIGSQTLSDFSAGRWLIFHVDGDVLFRFTSLAGPGAVLNGLFEDPSAPATPPSAFGGPTTTSTVVPGQVDLIWADKAGNEQGYTIERSLDGLHFTPIGSVGPGNGDTQSYTDTTALPNVYYYYRVLRLQRRRRLPVHARRTRPGHSRPATPGSRPRRNRRHHRRHLGGKLRQRGCRPGRRRRPRSADPLRPDRNRLGGLDFRPPGPAEEQPLHRRPRGGRLVLADQFHRIAAGGR